MRTLPSRLYIFAFCFICLIVPTVTCQGTSSSSLKTHIIDRGGTTIPSIFYAIAPNPRTALHNAEIMKARRAYPGSCSVRTAVLHEHDSIAKFTTVSGCGGHYQVDFFRICNYCGGEDDWTFSDSSISDYCTGSTSEYNGCATGNCLIEYTCYNNVSPGCY
jgi:hypothetical protein